MSLPVYSYPLAAPATTVVTSADGDLGGAIPYADLALDQATWDIEFPPRIVVGAAAIAQRIKVRLQFFRGEWFLDQRQGMPYFEAILRKNPDINLVSSLIRRAVLSTPGVLKIVNLRLALDSATRTLTVAPLEIVITGNLIFRAQPDEFLLALPRLV